MSAIAMTSGLSHHGSPMSTELAQNISNPRSHNETGGEVAVLSDKLITAINHQTDLEDTLNETRHRLDGALARIRQMELIEQEHQSALSNHILVKWEDIEKDTLRLRMNLAEERKQRVQAENQRKVIEQEVETLTAALFEEANQMVTTARKEAFREKEASEKRNEQLQTQLNEAEILLASHQEQLAELKSSMQEMSTMQLTNESLGDTQISAAPSISENQDYVNKLIESVRRSPAGLSVDGLSPIPTSGFSHFVSPPLRTEIPAFEDFQHLLEQSRASGSSSRVTSGNYGGLTGLGLSHIAKAEQSQVIGRLPSNGSTSSLSASSTHQAAPSTPIIPQSTNSSISFREAVPNTISLKDTAFYKRILVEDVEPTLRLDTAPGISWLAKRSVISSVSDGRLIVEPVQLSGNSSQAACAMCAEQRIGTQHARSHRFRLNDADNAHSYPLCRYCLGRIRSTCDFLGFLRMLRDGHWRVQGPHAELTAWEEAVRLRECMFWSRIGGDTETLNARAPSESQRTSTDEANPLPGTNVDLGQITEPDRALVGSELLTPAPIPNMDDVFSELKPPAPQPTPGSSLGKLSVDATRLDITVSKPGLGQSLVAEKNTSLGTKIVNENAVRRQRQDVGLLRPGESIAAHLVVGKSANSIAKRAAVFGQVERPQIPVTKDL